MNPDQPSGSHSSTWFHAGYRAFSAAFPTLVEKVPFSPFYVCPLCLRAFSQATVAFGLLTCDHVPPKNVGGRRLVLTCKSCNEQSGYALDHHAGREDDVLSFLTGTTLHDRKAWLSIDASTVPI